MDKKTVLVTGGAGYIGAHACKALAAKGFNPVVFDNLIYGHRSAVKWGPLEIGDLTNEWQIMDAIRRYRPIAVLHFAAFAYVGESVEDPDKYYYNNVTGALNLLRALVREKVNHLVFSSTCATYGNPETIPMDENHPQSPVNPYGAGKLMIERILSDFAAAYGLSSISLRYFNAAGADPDQELGEDHTPETHAIPLAISTALEQRPVFEIFGTDYPTEDGTAVRDYIHVSDLAAAHVAALSYLLEGGATTALNLGTGKGHSVRQVIAAVERISGKTVVMRETPRRSGDPAVLVADASRAERILGWKPVYAGLETIVSSAYAWHRLHFRLRQDRHSAMSLGPGRSM